MRTKNRRVRAWPATACLLLAAMPLVAQTEIRQAFPFEGPAGTTLPEEPPVILCQTTPDFAPRWGSTAQPFSGVTYVGFHENLEFPDDNEIFSVEIDRTLEAGASYVYRFMARIAPIDPATTAPGTQPEWEASAGGANSGMFTVYAGSSPCEPGQELGVIELQWDADNVWTEQVLQFVADGAHTNFTYAATAGLDVGDSTYFGIDDLVLQAPGIRLEKSAVDSGPLQAGDPVEYAFLVTNSGNVFLSNILITDPLEGLSAITCPRDSLDVGESMTCTATYTVTEADIDAGLIENIASVTGEPPFGDPVTDDDDADVPLAPPAPALPVLAALLLAMLLAATALRTLRRARA